MAEESTVTPPVIPKVGSIVVHTGNIVCWNRLKKKANETPTAEVCTHSMSLIMICRNSDYVLNLSCHHESANYLNILINTVVLIYVSYVTWKGFELVISYNIWFLEYLKRACSLVS
jgi:hypothetical protein